MNNKIEHNVVYLRLYCKYEKILATIKIGITEMLIFTDQLNFKDQIVTCHLHSLIFKI